MKVNIPKILKEMKAERDEPFDVWTYRPERDPSLYDTARKWPEYRPENDYIIQRIQSQIYPPSEMLVNIAVDKAMKRVGMINIAWAKELLNGVESIIELRQWIAQRELPF
jgi:hypothetical protein